LHPRYNKFYKANTPIADGVWQSILSIPLYPSMGANEIPYIIRATKTYINDLLIRLMVKKKRTFTPSIK
jgi:dTDP-4-amino-4,6-dideoxygalactose transaminase